MVGSSGGRSESSAFAPRLRGVRWFCFGIEAGFGVGINVIEGVTVEL